MIASPELNNARVSWPPDRFYWALLDPQQVSANDHTLPRDLRHGGLVPPGLLIDLGEQLPVPLDDLHAVCTPTSDGRLIACAASKEQLRMLDRSTAELGPDSIPPELNAIADAAAINLLIGPFEPQPIRRHRTQRHLVAMAIAVILSTLMTIGLFRRARHAEVLIQQTTLASKSLLQQTLPASPDVQSLAAELERARRIAGFDPSTKRSPDAAAALASLLSAWPTGIPTKPQSISVGPEGLSIAVLVPGDPSAFLSAFKSPAGWTMDEPRLTSVEAQTRLTLHLNTGRSKGGHP